MKLPKLLYLRLVVAVSRIRWRILKGRVEGGGMTGLYDYAILDAIDKFWREDCYPPTIRVLMEMSGATSTSVVWKALRRLAKQKHIVLRNARPIPFWVVDAIRSAEKCE